MTDADDVIQTFARALLAACGDCRVKIGLKPPLKPTRDTCPLCSHVAAVHGPRPVAQRNGSPHGPNGE